MNPRQVETRGEKVALILDAEAIAAVDVARDLDRSGVTCYAVGSRPNLLVHSRSAGRDRTLCLPVGLETGEILAEIVNLALRCRARVILPLGPGSTWLISTRRDMVAQALPETRFLVPPRDVLAAVLDKAVLYGLAARHGLYVPRTWLPAGEQDVRLLAGQVRYPALVKPRVTSGARGMVVCAGPAELEEGYAEVARVFPAPLVQEALPASSKIQVGVLRDQRTGVIAVSCLEVLRQYPLSGGPSTFVVTRTDGEAVRLALAFLENLKWEGLAHLEFLRDSRDGLLRLVDFNPRVWGTLGASLAGGVRFPRLLYDYLTRGDAGPTPAQLEGRSWRRLFFADVMVYLRYLESRLARQTAGRRWRPDGRSWKGPSFWRMWGFREGLWDSRDPRPFFANLLRGLAFGWTSRDALDYFGGRWGLRAPDHAPRTLSAQLERLMAEELDRIQKAPPPGPIGATAPDGRAEAGPAGGPAEGPTGDQAGPFAGEEAVPC